MNRVAGITHALLRIVAGFLFIHPGALKIFGWFGGMPPGTELTPLTATAGALELILGPLILVGFMTRPAAFLASGEMAFAYFIGHAPYGPWPVQNQGQPAVLFCFIFLFLFGNGPGPFSVDEWVRRRRGSRSLMAPVQQAPGREPTTS